MFISDVATLHDFCTLARREKVLAVDTEFIRERTYFPQLCLLQLGTHEETAAVDTLALDKDDLAPVAELLADDGITKVFHACRQDLEVISGTLGCVPSPIFDTQLAAAFLGHRHQIGYGALVKDMCGVSLPKASSLTDWARRPLDEDQLSYAEDDVRYLPEMYDRMWGELAEKDRLSWVMPEMEALAAEGGSSREPRSAYVHLKRAGMLTRRQLAIAREVCAWRERAAAKRNIPRKWVIGDEVIVEICRRAPKDTARLKRIRGTDQLSSRAATSLVRCVREGLDSDPSTYPVAKRRERPSAEVEGVLDLMYATLRLVSERSGVATQVIASRDDLLDKVQGRPGRLDRGWRGELAGAQLDRLLSGEVGLTVRGGKIELL